MKVCDTVSVLLPGVLMSVRDYHACTPWLQRIAPHLTHQELRRCLSENLLPTGVTLASPHNGLSQSLQFILKYIHAHMHVHT